MKPLLKPSVIRARVSDYDVALELLTTFGADDARKQHMTQLRDAKAAADTSREDATAAAAAATKRDKLAREAEADATRARQALADETAAARIELGQRETAVSDRENLATDAEKSQGLRDKELIRREDHLREAGVAGF